MIPQLEEAHGAHEDWTGLKDPKLRRRLQTRLNVRKHRRRMACMAESSSRRSSVVPSHPSNSAYAHHHPQAAAVFTRTRPVGPVTPPRRPSSTEFLSQAWASPYADSLLELFSHQSTFPLGPDHLIPLVQYNIIRATLTNMTILSIRHTLPDSYRQSWRNVPLFPPPDSLPDTLEPTALQAKSPHDTLVDLLPDPTLRDNAIRSASRVNWVDLCHDLLGRLPEGRNASLETAMLVWSDPWGPEGWEVTEGFAAKWGFLLRGCQRLLRSTNKWRQQRYEDPVSGDFARCFEEEC